jgi:hypothetical protein
MMLPPVIGGTGEARCLSEGVILRFVSCWRAGGAQSVRRRRLAASNYLRPRIGIPWSRCTSP